MPRLRLTDVMSTAGPKYGPKYNKTCPNNSFPEMSEIHFQGLGTPTFSCLSNSLLVLTGFQYLFYTNFVDRFSGHCSYLLPSRPLRGRIFGLRCRLRCRCRQFIHPIIPNQQNGPSSIVSVLFISCIVVLEVTQFDSRFE